KMSDMRQCGTEKVRDRISGAVSPVSVCRPGRCSGGSGSEMPTALPLATYRLQLTADFGFERAAEIVPYLKALGITHVYASPFMKARRGSTHGYDITDHTKLNPELGGEES